MRKVRITKEQLETIVESTLNNGQPQAINEIAELAGVTGGILDVLPQRPSRGGRNIFRPDDL